MPEGYLHLTCEQRCQIYALLQSGHSQAHIARQIGVDPSTISRELVRNTGARGYRFKQAHEKASQRREEASDKPRKMTPDLVELIEEKLTQEQWSPDQISGRLAKDGVAFISHERISACLERQERRGHAHSTVKCNGQISGAEENLARGLVAEYLSGARVEFVLDPLDIGIGQNREVGTFWEVLPEEAVSVFVEAAFPRVIGLGKIG